MKRLFFLVAAVVLTSAAAFGQAAKKPTLMVLPSDVWCNEHGYMMEYDDQGATRSMPDYRRALQNDADLLLVIDKIGQMMSERGFDLKKLDQALKTLDNEAAEESMLQSKSGDETAETPYDKLKKTAKADILMQIYWRTTSMGPRRQVTFNISGIDAYTDKQIANGQGTGQPSMGADVAVLLSEAVIQHIDTFNEQLLGKFNDWFENGREITIRMKRFSACEYDFESEVGPDDEELGVIIENWLADNCVGGRFNTTDATADMMFFEEVHIPMINDKGRAMDARSFARGIQSLLQKQYQIETKLTTKGLGGATLIIGGK